MSNNAIRTPLGHRRAGTKPRRVNPLARRSSGSAYQIAGKTLAEFAAAFLWLALWLFNGFCTVVAWIELNHWLFYKLGRADDPLVFGPHRPDPAWLSLWLLIPTGIVAHLLVSAIEQHLWRSATGPAPDLAWQERCKAVLRSVRTWESVAIGSLDSFTTSRTLVALALLFGFAASLPTTFWCTVLGTALALGTEPMLRYHGITLKSLPGR